MKKKPPPVKDFSEATDWFKSKVPMTKDEWEALDSAAQEKAFTVAGVAQLDVVSQVHESLERAIESGQSFDEWQKNVADTLESAWGESMPYRLETIFRTNVQMAYGEGRYAQLTDPDVLSDRPFWRYTAILDASTSDLCSDLNGTVLPAESAFWNSHWPPLHHQCRSGVHSLSEDEAQEYGVTKRIPKGKADEGFGSADPVEWQPDLADYPPELVKVYRRRQ